MNITEFKEIIWEYTRKINESTNSIVSPLCTPYGLTIMQLRILMELSRNSSHSIGTLANKTFAAETNISSMCKKLESMGFIVRSRDRKDERVVNVNLTENGINTVEIISKALDTLIMKQVEDQPQESIEQIVNGVKKLSDLLEKVSQSKSNT